MRRILTYHGLNARGWAYENNDHTALWHDLRVLEHIGHLIQSGTGVVCGTAGILLLDSD